MKFALRICLALAVFALVTLPAHSRPVTVEAQTPIPQCQLGSATYSAAACAAATGNSPYCQPATYVLALCAQATTNTGGSIYCQGPTYNAGLCSLYSGNQNQNTYCQGVNYNANLCAQYGGTSNQSIYCLQGTPTYSATLCAQYGNATSSTYCQLGTANYSAALCAQFGGGGNCQADYSNTGLCTQYRESIPSTLSVTSNAVGLNCGGKATVTVAVRNSFGGPVPNGTSVSFVATQGTITPPQVTTDSGFATTTFTAPINSGVGSANITATSGGITGNTSFTLNCQPAAPTPVPTPVTLAAIAPAAIPALPFAADTRPVISPPNTGDAGLLSD